MIGTTDISSLLQAMNESRFDEIELTVDGLHIQLRRGCPLSKTLEDDSEQTLSANSTVTTSVPVAAAVAVNAPTLGTFYIAPSPGAEPFVKVGDRVTVGQQMGIVEVMKLFNTIEASVNGTVIEIHAEDAALVEYGQALISIVPDQK